MDVRLYPCHAKSTRRAGLVRAALFAHVVEGKSYTTRQIASRLGVTTDTALTRAKRGPFPLTWASLQQSRLVKS
ncbi:MAG: hypothetical protein RR704_00810 [Stenotrophomonas sp.]